MAEHESSEALAVENLKPNEEEEEEEEEEEGMEEEEAEEESDEGDGEEREGEFRSSEPQSGEENSKASRLETLALPSSSEKDQCAGVQANSTPKLNAGTQSEDKVQVLNEEVQANSIGQDADARAERQHKSTVCRSLSELSPTSVTQPISSAPSPTPVEQRLSPPKDNGLHKDRKNSSALKAVTPISVVKIPSSDGYNWRKYGQKQVKSPEGSRSYYKCTHSECYAKKIECCDHTGCVTEIVYKSQHSHDPPKKGNARETKLSSGERASGTSVTKQPCRTPKDADACTSAKESVHETPQCSERKRQNSVSSDENGALVVKEEHVDEPEAKRRLKRSHLEYSDSVLKPSKKPKFVVHAAGDVGISGDGYRWRKYGQKMVKGNPHPRNYYRCTSAGCPVRKHIETAVDNTSAVIITYKGVHDHDRPVPKKRHGPPSAPLVAAAAPASKNNTQVKKSETVKNKNSSTQWSVDNEGGLTGEALDLGGEKAMESARTLLSIGFEIKPC